MGLELPLEPSSVGKIKGHRARSWRKQNHGGSAALCAVETVILLPEARTRGTQIVRPSMTPEDSVLPQVSLREVQGVRGRHAPAEGYL